MNETKEKVDWSEGKKENKTKGSKIVYHLDWNAQSYEDRLACVQKLQEEGKMDSIGGYQINEVANYLLYSSDVDCEVKLKKPSKRQISYEELIEMGVADAAINNAKNKNVYKSYRPTIDREMDKDIPGMEELWEEIAKVKEIYDYLDDCLKGRREKDNNRKIEVSYAKHYFYKNWYIDLCLQQYSLKDFYKPIKNIRSQDVFHWSDREEYDLRVKVGNEILIEGSERNTIDLSSPSDIHLLLRYYKTIKDMHEDTPLDEWSMLYDLLDEAISISNLNDCTWDILERKVWGWRNDNIGNFIEKKYGIRYNDNYISTIFTRTISKKIAKGANSMAKRKNKTLEQKKCIKCKKDRWVDEFKNNRKTCGYCAKNLINYGRKIQKEVI